MAGIDVSVGKELLPGLLGSQDGLAKLVEAVLNQILKAQMTESLGAERHERNEDREVLSRCSFRRRGTAAFRQTCSSATRGASRRSCWR